MRSLRWHTKKHEEVFKMRGYSAIGLCGPKNSSNVGSAVRAAVCYRAAMIVIQNGRYQRPSSDTTKGWKHTPLIHTSDMKEVIPYSCIPIAVECCEQARPILNFVHPERAMYIFGPEDGSISNKVLDWCKYIIEIPTVFCMNLGATVNVVLYDRMLKGYQNANQHNRC